MNDLRRLGSLLVLMIVVAIALVARTADPRSVPGSTSPTPSAVAEQSASPASTVATVDPPPTDCLDISIHSDRMPLTVANLASVSTRIVAGTFNDYGPAQWNSSDGKRPPGASSHTPDMIYRPAVIAPDRVLTGAPTEGDIIARVDGGAVGCDTYTVDSSPELKVGGRYLFYLSYSVDSTGTYISDPSIIEAWVIDAGDQVKTPLEGALTVDQVETAADKVTFVLPPLGK